VLKHTLTPPTYFQGVRTPPMIYVPVHNCGDNAVSLPAPLVRRQRDALSFALNRVLNFSIKQNLNLNQKPIRAVIYLHPSRRRGVRCTPLCYKNTPVVPPSGAACRLWHRGCRVQIALSNHLRLLHF